MLTTFIAKPIMALLAMSFLSASFVNDAANVKEGAQTRVSCSNKTIYIQNDTHEDITKVIADGGDPAYYADNDDIYAGTDEDIRDYGWDTSFDLHVKFNYQPTLGYRIRVYDINGLVDCLDIQTGVYDYIFPNLTACGDYTIVYEELPC